MMFVVLEKLRRCESGHYCLHRQMVPPLHLEGSLERSWAQCTADIRHIQVTWDIHTSADRPRTSVHCFDTIDCRLGNPALVQCLGNPALAHCLGNRVVVHCLGIDSPRHGSSKEWEHDRGPAEAQASRLGSWNRHSREQFEHSGVDFYIEESGLPSCRAATVR